MHSRKIWYYRTAIIILLFATLLAWALVLASMTLSIAALRRLPLWTNRV